MTTKITTTSSGTTERGGTNSARALWTGGWRCEVEAGGFCLVVDEPAEVGGTGTGPMPTDLLLVLTVESSLPEEQMAALLEPAKRACYVSNTFAFVPSVTVELA